MTSAVKFQGTVQGKATFNPDNEAKTLHDAMKGFGVDEKAIIKDLIDELKSELSGDFKELCVACFEKADDYDAKQLQEAMVDFGTNESTLIEIMCNRSNAEIKAIKAAYQKLFGRELEKDLIKETSGHFMHLLVSICKTEREENTKLDEEKIKADAKELIAAGKQFLETNDVFCRIIANKSYAYLKKVFEQYHKISGQDMEEAIKSNFYLDTKKILKAIVRIVRDPPAYFAHLLHKSMKGLGTRDTALIRAVVTRCEVDMVQIKQRFLTKYGKTLASFIIDDTNGDYQKLLLALIGEPQ